MLIVVITKHHSRQRLKDTQRTDETLCQLTATNSIPEISSLQDTQSKVNDLLENGKIENYITTINNQQLETSIPTVEPQVYYNLIKN